MEFKVTINTDNAAFEGCNGMQIADILRDLAERIDEQDLDGNFACRLTDINGNVVGEATHA